MMQTFTPEELAELAAFDAEVDDEPLTMEELRESHERDRRAELDAMDNRCRAIAEHKRQYYKANKDAIAEYQRQYYEANKNRIKQHRREQLAKRKQEEQA